MDKRQYILIALVVLITFVLFLGINSSSSLNEKRSNVELSLKKLDNFLVRRVQNAEEINLILGPKLKERDDLFKALIEASQDVKNKANIADKSEANVKLSGLIRQIFLASANNKDIVESTAYKNIRQDHVDTTALLAKAANEYNEYVNIYNKELSSFPGNIVNKFKKYKLASSFNIAEGNTYFNNAG